MKEKDYCIEGEQEVSSSLKGRRMQMNALRAKQVSHVGSRDDHGQPIAGGDDQKCRSTAQTSTSGNTHFITAYAGLKFEYA